MCVALSSSRVMFCGAVVSFTCRHYSRRSARAGDGRANSGAPHVVTNLATVHSNAVDRQTNSITHVVQTKKFVDDKKQFGRLNIKPSGCANALHA